MLTYSQSRGWWTLEDGPVIVMGCYSGKNACKNEPASEFMANIGVLPRGKYTLGPLHTIPHLGPAMPLTPAPTNDMEGRFGFFVHLDNPAHPGESSDGCIVAPSLAALVDLDKRRVAGETQVTVIA